MGHIRRTQLHLNNEFHHSRFRLEHGGILRQKRRGRRARPISTRNPIHLVFKAERKSLRRGFRSPLAFAIITRLVKVFAKRFFIRIHQCSINHDHLHLVIRTSRRSLHHHFLRVTAGQIAQEFQKNGLMLMKVTDTPGAGARGSRETGKRRPGDNKVKLWKHRPFTRLVKGLRGFRIVMNYVRLNEKEARGEIPYRKERLRGLSSTEWELLWK